MITIITNNNINRYYYYNYNKYLLYSTVFWKDGCILFRAQDDRVFIGHSF